MTWERKKRHGPVDLPMIAPPLTIIQVDLLEHVFTFEYNYKVSQLRLQCKKHTLPQVDLIYNLAKFVKEEDGPKSLLIVYYAGHGTPGHVAGGLELFGFVASYCFGLLLD